MRHKNLNFRVWIDMAKLKTVLTDKRITAFELGPR